MPLEPRFRRVAAFHRPFVDRESVLAAFAEVLRARRGSPRVFNVVGVGGIGKSRLLQEIRQRCTETYRTATLDLQIPAMRQQEDALAVLRVELGRQGVRFDRFDIAYAVLWQRLHPHLRLSSKDLPFVDESEALSQVLDGAAGVPVFGTGVGLMRLLGKATSGMRQRQRIKSDDTLSKLDDLTNAELADAVTYLFAEDLRDGSDRPYVILIDAYEALAPAAVHGRALAQDVWLRDLIAQLDGGVVVLASREPLPWAAQDPGWADVIHHQRVDGLPMAARLELLADGGIADQAARQAIATASQGLPFYLHLALDTRTTARQAAVVSSEEILQRFLAHVAPDEIRTLELLSVARIFDYEIFQAVADEFDLPRHRMAWESLTAYSFVYPAGSHGWRLHQLMRAALHDRLSPETVRDVHALLRNVWDSRAYGDHTAENGVATRARAVREAAYCGLGAGDLDGAEVLGYADRAMMYGGKQAFDGVTQDLRDHLDAGSDDPELAQTARCLEAESAVLLGDAAAATRLTPSIDWALEGVPGARLALAGAHGRRIAGATNEAVGIFRQVWDQHPGPVRLRAGFCIADLDMCQGRFGDALSITQQILADAPDDDLVLRGDVVRLQHLGYRFGFDFDSSARSLEAAADLYARAGAIIGQADIKTNRAELLAWTDPPRALDAATEAIEAQTELGAHHEIGKAFTALAIAQLRLGQHLPAAASFQTATESLERALPVRAGPRGTVPRLPPRPDRPHRRRRDVRPLGCRRAGRRRRLSDPPHGRRPSAGHPRRGRRAHHGSDGPCPCPDKPAAPAAILERSSPRARDGHAGGRMNWRDLYERARAHGDSAAGYYNDNIRIETGDGPVIVRIPIHGADMMDLRPWREDRVLAAIAPHVRDAPRLLHTSADPPFQVHEFIPGDVLNDVAPRGVPVPPHVLDDVVRLFTQLTRVPRLPDVPASWPADEDTAAFARLLSDLTQRVYDTFSTEYAGLFTALAIPADPLAPVDDLWRGLTPRPFTCVHADVHRRNMIVGNGATTFLDWELTLWGDPVYDLAVHIHKMGYLPEERDALLARWQTAMPSDLITGWQKDLDAYLTHERIKSAIVDSVRYSQLFARGGPYPYPEHQLIDTLTAKLNAARPYWRLPALISPQTVEKAIRSH